MEKFNKFYFEKYSFDEKNLKASFLYSFDKKEYFEEIIDFSADLKIEKKLDKNIISNYLFNLHIALGISYYKLFPTKDLIIESGFLNENQIFFWKKFYKNGLGEFLIKNNISFSNLFNFIIKDKSKKYLVDLSEKKDNKTLLLWGGGKDSIVSYSIIKDTNFDIFIVGKLDKIKENTIKVTNKKPINILRKLSDNLFILNNKGYYNGHVPITGIIAFISIVFVYLYDYKNIILSNEKSSSEGNTIYNGLKINHQYSKSIEFENDFKSYIEKYITKNTKYFSLLRGMYEYKISEIFSKNEDFFPFFSSCNNNFKINKNINLKDNWCSKCEKCCFVFLILSNFIGIDELKNIFGNNLFEDKDLENIFKSLIGFGENKPFECVGTYEESLFSAIGAIKKYKEKNFYILENLDKLINNSGKVYDFEKMKNKLLKIYDDDIIPDNYKKLLYNF